MTIEIPDAPSARLGDAWRAIGTGRANLSLRRDFVESAALAQDEIGFRYIRGHGLFHDDMGVVRLSQGVRRLSFTYLDEVFDGYVELGLRPIVELGFMPVLLASGKQTVFWWQGNVTPPRDMAEWTDLVTATLRHLIDRYGADEVRYWPVEVWNEPNHPAFWQDADQRAYFELYAATARAVKQVDAALQVGGPATCPDGDDWVRAFGEFVAAGDLPCDFIATHAYSSGPAQHIPFGVYQTLRPPQGLLDQFTMPRRVLAGTALAAKPNYITEFNTSYRPDNPIHDTAYNAAYLAPVLAGGSQTTDLLSYWPLCDVFEEEGVPTSLFHGGFGLLGRHQLRKPTWHLYAFMGRLGDEILALGHDHLVTRHADGRLALLAWQPLGGSDDGAYGSAPASHRLSLSLPVGPAPEVAWLRHRVNERAGNAWTAWRDLGRPPAPTPRAMQWLYDAAEPMVEHGTAPVAGQRVWLDLTLERHEVCLVEVQPVTPWRHEGLDDARLLGQAV